MFEYCENSSFLISQITNVISNLSFFVIGFLIYYRYRRTDLFVVCMMIGSSSTIWHLSENLAALYADKIIVGLACIYLAICLIRPYFDNRFFPPVITVFMMGLSILFAQTLPIDQLWTSAFVIPLIGLLTLALLDPPNRATLFYAAVFLSAACMFRMVDMSICEHLSSGTHSLWHLGTAISIYFVSKAINQKHPQAVRGYNFFKNN